LVSAALGNIPSSMTSFWVGEDDDETDKVSGECDGDRCLGDPVTSHTTSSLTGPGDWSTVSVLSIVGEAASSPLLADGDGVKSRSSDVNGSTAKDPCTFPGRASVRRLPELDAPALTPTVGAGSEKKQVAWDISAVLGKF